MPIDMEQYVGKLAEIVYLDSAGRLTRRRVSVYSVRGGKARVLDWGKRSLGTLAVRRIVDARPVTGGVGAS